MEANVDNEDLDAGFEIDHLINSNLAIAIIKILAEILPDPYLQLPTQLNEFAQNYPRHEKLFSPVTYAIYWNSPNFTQILADNQKYLEHVDGYTNTPLNLALQLERFTIADNLIEAGAKLFFEDRVMLEIAILNIYMRDFELINKIMKNLDNFFIIEFIKFLDLVESSINNKKAAYKFAYRDLINAPINRFGNAINAVIFHAGTSSLHGYISTSVIITSSLLLNFVKQNTSFNQSFKDIAKGLTKSQKIFEFNANLPTNENSSEKIYHLIQENSYKENQVVFLLGGWAGAGVSLVLVGKKLIYTHLGTAADRTQEMDVAINIYTLTASEFAKITPEFIKSWSQGLSHGKAPMLAWHQLSQILSQTCQKIYMRMVPIDNAIYANLNASIFAALFLLNQEDIAKAKEAMQNFKEYCIDASIEEIIKQLKNPKVLRDYKIECANAAVSYINLNYFHATPQILLRCTKLAYTLEYLGLQPLMQLTLDPTAVQQINNFIQQTQNKEAVEVIYKQYQQLGITPKNSYAIDKHIKIEPLILPGKTS